MSSQRFVGRNANRADRLEVVVLWLGNSGFSSPIYFQLGLCIMIILTGTERFGDSCPGYLWVTGYGKEVLCIWPAAHLELSRPITNQLGDKGSEDSWLLSSNFVT